MLRKPSEAIDARMSSMGRAVDMPKTPRRRTLRTSSVEGTPSVMWRKKDLWRNSGSQRYGTSEKARDRRSGKTGKEGDDSGDIGVFATNVEVREVGEGGLGVEGDEGGVGGGGGTHAAEGEGYESIFRCDEKPLSSISLVSMERVISRWERRKGGRGDASVGFMFQACSRARCRRSRGKKC